MSDLARFEAMLQLSRQMVDAAGANDWDRLIALEEAEAELRQALRLRAPADYAKLSADERERIGELIREIQADHAKVHDIVGPWLGSVQQLLARQTRERNVRESYGAFTQAP